MSCENSNTSLPIGATGATGAAGAAGAAGATGASGTTVLYSNTTPTSTTNPGLNLLGTAHTLQFYNSPTIVVNCLKDAGDSLELIATLSSNVNMANQLSQSQFRVYMGVGSIMPIILNDITMPKGADICLLRVVITRKTSTVCHGSFNADFSDGVAQSCQSIGGQYAYETTCPVSNLDNANNDIKIMGGVVDGTLTLQNLLILKYKI